MPITKFNYLRKIRRQYGRQVEKNVFYYGKILFRISKIKSDLLFLKTCKKENILPNFTRIKIPITHQHHKRAIQLCYRELLLNEIKIKKRLLTQNYKVYTNLKPLIAVDLIRC